MAHELGHLYGLPHVDAATGEVGWDVLNRLEQADRSKPAKFLDLMNAPNRDDMGAGFNRQPGGREPPGTWIKRQHYEDVMDAQIGTASLITSTYRLVTGGRDEGEQAEWSLYFEFWGPHEPISPSAVGEAEVRLLDAQGEILYATQVELMEIPVDVESEDHAAFFGALVPSLTDTHRIALYMDSEPAAVITRTANVPAITITSPEAYAVIDDETVITWDAVECGHASWSAWLSCGRSILRKKG